MPRLHAEDCEDNGRLDHHHTASYPTENVRTNVVESASFMENRMKSKTTTRPSLVKLYEEYHASRLTFGRELTRNLAIEAARDDWKGAKVLDVGCGEGSIAQAFAESGARVTAIEYSRERVATIAHRQSENPAQANFELVSGDAHHLPFSDQDFDLLILADVLEHVKDPWQVMKEVSRVLKPHGLLYAAMPNRFSIINLLSDPHYSVPGVGLMPRWMAEWYVVKFLRLTDGYWTEKYFSYNEVTKLFCNFGFEWKELRGRYEKKIRAGEISKVPSRKWMTRSLRLPGVRRLALSMVDGEFFRHFIQPGWDFLAVKSGEQQGRA